MDFLPRRRNPRPVGRRRPRRARRPRRDVGGPRRDVGTYFGTVYNFAPPDYVGARDENGDDRWIADVNRKIQKKRDEDPQAFEPTYVDTPDGPKTILYVGPANAIALDVTRPHPDKGFPSLQTAIGRITFFLNRGKAGGYVDSKRANTLKKAMKIVRGLYSSSGKMERMRRRNLENKVSERFRKAIEKQQRLRKKGDERGRERVAGYFGMLSDPYGAGMTAGRRRETSGWLGSVHPFGPVGPTGYTSFGDDGDYVGARDMNAGDEYVRVSVDDVGRVFGDYEAFTDWLTRAGCTIRFDAGTEYIVECPPGHAGNVARALQESGLNASVTTPGEVTAGYYGAVSDPYGSGVTAGGYDDMDVDGYMGGFTDPYGSGMTAGAAGGGAMVLAELSPTTIMHPTSFVNMVEEHGGRVVHRDRGRYRVEIPASTWDAFYNWFDRYGVVVRVLTPGSGVTDGYMGGFTDPYGSGMTAGAATRPTSMKALVKRVIGAFRNAGENPHELAMEGMSNDEILAVAGLKPTDRNLQALAAILSGSY